MTTSGAGVLITDDLMVFHGSAVTMGRGTWEREHEIADAARNLARIKTDELQCWVEHWGDGKCEQEAKDSLAAYNTLVDVLNR